MRYPRQLIRSPAAAAGLSLVVSALQGQTRHFSLVDLMRELDGPGGMDAVTRVQILRVSLTAEYRARVSESFIEQNAEVRCEAPFTPTGRTDFLLARHKAAPRNGDAGVDLRWSAIFLDRQGIALHRLSVNGRYFLEGTARRGYLDGIAVALRPGLDAWFAKALADCRGGKPGD